VLDGAGDEPLDLIDDRFFGRVEVPEPEGMVDARKGDEARPGDAIGQQLAGLDREHTVTLDVQHERRHVHRRQDVAHIDLQGGIRGLAAARANVPRKRC